MPSTMSREGDAKGSWTMKSKTASLANQSGRRKSSAMGLRAGIARDQLIFVIICLAATAVAIIALVIFFMPARTQATSVDWQCLECNYKFNIKTTGPITAVHCPKCSGQAVAVRYGKCPHCGKHVPMYRCRMSETEQEQGLNMPGVSGPLGMHTQRVPEVIQYWIGQADGSYGWSRWMGTTDPQIGQARADSRCPQCRAKLFVLDQ